MESLVVKSLLSKLASLLGDEFTLQKAVREDVRHLRDELKSINAALQNVPDVEDPGVRDKDWIEKVRELSYDMEDSIDEFMFRVKREPGFLPHGFSLRRIKKRLAELKTRRRIADQIREIKSRIAEVSGRRERYRIEDVVSEASNLRIEPRLTASYADGLVGVDGPRDELVNLLRKEEGSESAGRVKVVSVVGSGGLGKTALVSQVYQTVRSEFHCWAWVPVSSNPDMRRILKGILLQLPNLPGEDEGEWDVGVLIDKIRKSLEGKRYLFILDDIWSEEAWETIRRALPMNSFGSRIITTTRIYRVAASCSRWNGIVYQMGPLSMDDSRRLFHRRIFGSDPCPQELLQVSDKIIKKCAGLPLAISTVSSLLASKEGSVSQWVEVMSCIGTTLERSPTLEGIRSILHLSYFDLPSYLKACLLYLSVFPEDYEINRDRLVMMWIAEGLIQQKSGRSLKETGESYFNELVNRSMIQPTQIGYDGQPRACLVHYAVLEFIISIATEENFATLPRDQDYVYNSRRKIRRLALNNISKEQSVLASMNEPHIRSLTIFGGVEPIFPLQHFKFLRVLDLEGCTDLKNHNIKEIVELLHLRYLSIRDTPISELPAQIGGLCFLTTLDLRGTELRELPSTIVHLRRLAYLLCDKMRFPEGIGSMKALSVLSQFDILQSEIFVVEELGGLSELRELVIWWSPEIEFSGTERYERLAFSLYRLNKLHSLCIHGSDSSVDFLDHLRHPLQELHSIQLNSRCYLSRIPEWFRSLPSLAYVCIDVKEVKNEDLQLLSELLSLRHLSLSSKSMATEKLVIGSHGFPVLREFQLHSARADLTFQSQAMEKLERLLLSFHVLTEETYGFSFSIEHLMNLKKIDIKIDGKGEDPSQFEAAEVAIRKAADDHRNHPIVNIVTLGNLADDAAKEEKKKEQKLETSETQIIK